MKSNKFLSPLVAILVASGILFGVSIVVANAQSTDSLPSLAQSIATKFDLNESDVQTLINTYSEQQQEKRLQSMELRQKNRLDKLVSQGKISSSQESNIINELHALRSKYSLFSLQNMTAQQRKQSLKNERTALKSWASSKGIDFRYILPAPVGIHFELGKQSVTPTP